MLKRLSIENYALIDHLDIEFPGDLVIITGETGAGKSVMLGALSLLLGARADASAIKDKSHNCVVEAEFGGETDMIVRRVVNPAGRSRAFIDDEPVSLDQLRDAAGGLVDIHSQHQQLLLSDRKFQLAALDGFASLGGELRAYDSLYSEYTECCGRLERLDSELASDARERDYLEFQYEQLKAASLKPGELEELEMEHSRLANSEQIREGLAKVNQIFEGNGVSMESSLKEVENILSRLSHFLPDLAGLAERLESSRLELKDICGDIASREESIECSPQRLSDVEQRMSMLYDLMRKHSVENAAALVDIRDSLAKKLGDGADREAERVELSNKCDALKKSCEDASRRLHKSRVEAAPRFSMDLEKKIKSLEMPYAKFRVRIDEKPTFGPDGKDDIVFEFNANGGEFQNLAKCASGGELSRIMLCLKSEMAKYTGMPTLIFDEIDTGVSGSIADKMGAMVVDAGKSMQVFAITHLPQVASKGSAHYLVYKENEGGTNPQTRIRRIEGEERVREIARMLSGSTLTDAALANARVLLDGNK